MAMLLPPDFKEFLRLLNDHDVRYLLVGGLAVGLHGYPRSTSDMDIWIQTESRNIQLVIDVIRAFGFDTPNLSPVLFDRPRRILRMGHPPVRIEVMNSIDGVEFETCFVNRIDAEIDGITVPVISLSDLRQNKTASGRPKDLDDLEHLPNNASPI